jgi:hypothetical protein
MGDSRGGSSRKSTREGGHSKHRDKEKGGKKSPGHHSSQITYGSSKCNQSTLWKHLQEAYTAFFQRPGKLGAFCGLDLG